jgi:purine-binding chemotaxis protein CheW
MKMPYNRFLAFILARVLKALFDGPLCRILNLKNQGGAMPEGSNDTETPAGEKYLIFTILGKHYALPSRLIGEIAVFDAVYPLPLLPDYVPGIINRYSTPYALIDVGLFFRKTATPRAKVLALKEQVDRAAILIDDVVDIVDISFVNLLQVEHESDASDITSVITASFSWNKNNVFVLDIRKILDRIVNEAGS